MQVVIGVRACANSLLERLAADPARVLPHHTSSEHAPGGCTALDRLPAGFGGLSALQKLDLFGCVALSALPQTFGNLASLIELDLSNCTSLQSLPASFGAFVNTKADRHAEEHAVLYCIAVDLIR